MRVLVCGSNYGRTYITALAREPRKYQLAGILAQGSQRSLCLAALSGVPLFHSADELPDNIDLACGAMSSAAFPGVLQLLRRGIHVLCEHPYSASSLQKAFALTRKRYLQFHVNGHFVNLPAPQAFVRACRQADGLAAPEFVDVMVTERSLYGALDILLLAMGGRQPLRARLLDRRNKFALLQGTLGRIPLKISVQVSGKTSRDRLADGSPNYLLDMRLTAAFPHGMLTLLSMAGPVVWNATATRAQKGEPLWAELGQRATRTVAELGKERIAANLEALNAIRKSILKGVTPATQQPRHILRVARAWELVGRQLYSD